MRARPRRVRVVGEVARLVTSAGDRPGVVWCLRRDQVRDGWLVAARQEAACARVDRAVSQCRALHLAQVVCPRLHNEALQVTPRLSWIPKQCPTHCTIAPSNTTELTHAQDELTRLVHVDEVFGGDQHRPFFRTRRILHFWLGQYLRRSEVYLLRCAERPTPGCRDPEDETRRRHGQAGRIAEVLRNKAPRQTA